MKRKLVELIRRFTWLDWLLLVLLLAFLSYFVVVSAKRFLNHRQVEFEFMADAGRGVATESIWVDVSGSVISPGVYQLPAESRIKDALVAAGGFAKEADREYVAREINLAAKITDGQKIFVPAVLKTTPQTEQVLGTKNKTRLNLNTASVNELMSLPGIGEVRATDIIKNRPYIKADDLVTKKVLGKSIFDKIHDLVTVY